MLTRRAAKFCVEPWSAFSKISHHYPETIWKGASIVSWSESQPEVPNDPDDGDEDDKPPVFLTGHTPSP